MRRKTILYTLYRLYRGGGGIQQRAGEHCRRRQRGGVSNLDIKRQRMVSVGLRSNFVPPYHLRLEQFQHSLHKFQVIIIMFAASSSSARTQRLALVSVASFVVLVMIASSANNVFVEANGGEEGGNNIVDAIKYLQGLDKVYGQAARPR